ncbi:RNA polymerase sigma factor [Cellulomonas aerilata]|uniref:RNA polymerase subunit sigma-24 n=1 Tax=Cellulomonas aerilata TaxID=515326 RepID=A0A512DCD6_9CELL|nr:sigma-70 family RNA polymerase sigma factor [Cellulomonas aerilata]GEO34113.1 RNA polymerase subunit sigma-24 [Cellulomonas aerilata]
MDVPAADVAAAVADAHRREWALVLAATVRVVRDLDMAEECAQDAFAQALAAWPGTGVPRNPGAWLTTVARRRGVDAVRREQLWRRAVPLLVDDEPAPGPDEVVAARQDLPDDRLRLVFTCCHPGLGRDAQVALTLRLVCGLTTAEVARAFLVSEPTMAARLTRAKKKIAAARIPYRVPPPEERPGRVAAVLEVVHLVFTTGHTAPAGADLVRRDLVERALDLARMLRVLLPDDPDVAGLLALVLLTDSRRATRTDDGRLLLLEEQDRSRWNTTAIREGVALVREALEHRPPGRYALQAAISAVHAESPTWEDTDWQEIAGLYDALVAVWPSPVVALNRAVAVGLARGPRAGLAEIDALRDEPTLATYPYAAAARADFLRRLGRVAEARLAYEEALHLTTNEVERAFLERRLAEL